MLCSPWLKTVTTLSSLPTSLLKEWNYTKNDEIGLSPDELPQNSNKKAWWICSVCGHEWIAKITNRNHGRGCPVCANKVIVDGLITLIDEFLSLNYSLNFDKSKVSKCNCDSITEPNNCNIRIIEDYKQVLNWIKNNKTEENTNKIKIYGSSFGELLPNLQF